jgi:hypothetical protein
MLRASDNTARPNAGLWRLDAQPAAKPKSSNVGMRYSMEADYPAYCRRLDVHGSHSDNVKHAPEAYLGGFAA